jgi:hypothetical protein
LCGKFILHFSPQSIEENRFWLERVRWATIDFIGCELWFDAEVFKFEGHWNP